ncbi:hypothetical protein QBC39DRAFT_77639 [Podospora conica]|nr:hypothetical protein QBC39DRAFT_77639 [Schizothecium conicum]
MPATIQPPQQQAPMEAANPASAPSATTVVTQQPKSQPLPSLEGEQGGMSLRGGNFGISCGQRCCGMNCHWYKGCC